MHESQEEPSRRNEKRPFADITNVVSLPNVEHDHHISCSAPSSIRISEETEKLAYKKVRRVASQRNRRALHDMRFVTHSTTLSSPILPNPSNPKRLRDIHQIVRAQGQKRRHAKLVELRSIEAVVNVPLMEELQPPIIDGSPGANTRRLVATPSNGNLHALIDSTSSPILPLPSNPRGLHAMLQVARAQGQRRRHHNLAQANVYQLSVNLLPREEVEAMTTNDFHTQANTRPIMVHHEVEAIPNSGIVVFPSPILPVPTNPLRLSHMLQVARAEGQRRRHAHLDEVHEIAHVGDSLIRNDANGPNREGHMEVNEDNVSASIPNVGSHLDEVHEIAHVCDPLIRSDANAANREGHMEENEDNVHASIPNVGSRRVVNLKKLLNIARIPNFEENHIRILRLGDRIDSMTGRFSVGLMNVVCPTCNALHWKCERVKYTRFISSPFSMCCGHGKIQLPYLTASPSILAELLSGMSSNSLHFLRNARAYNSALQLASTGAHVTEQRGGTGNFRIQGGVYHSIGPLHAESGAPPQFAQIYIHDDEHQMEHRRRIMSGDYRDQLRPEILRGLQDMLHAHNPYVALFRNVAIDPCNSDFHIVLKGSKRGLDAKRYTLPVASEIAAILPGDGSEPVEGRDIIVRLHGGGIRRLSDLNEAYIPLHFVLPFVYGEAGWHPGIPLQGQHDHRDDLPLRGDAMMDEDRDDIVQGEIQGEVTTHEASSKTITALQFASFRLQMRANAMDNNRLLRFGRLTQEYMVDMYATIEMQRLTWIRLHQKELRADLYQGVRDAMTRHDVNGQGIGRRIILPSSFIGGPRHMHQLYHDAMAIVRHFGKPDYFLTMTCNPKWPEITSALLHGQSTSDRPDLVVRVFQQKKKELLRLILDKHILGRVVGCIHVVEFQKRGLPHVHILIILASEDKPRTTSDYDDIISAEIPNPMTHPRLHSTVRNCMIHGPCGVAHPTAPCTDKTTKKCSKGYPMPFASMTMENEDGYPIYKRRDNGRLINKSNHDFDNRWVVPYNPMLCTLFDCHINLEITNSILAVKYFYKYVYKGSDAISYTLANTTSGEDTIDETSLYLDARYVSSSEACWRIFKFSLHAEQPSIVRLIVHLPDSQMVYFHGQDSLGNILERSKETTLTQWFATNVSDSTARQYLYLEFPSHYSWNKKQWHPRKRARKGCGHPIGRLYMTNPAEGERHWLRLLLHHVRGAQSYQDLRTIDGVVYPTFKETAIQMGLLEDDREIFSCFEEAVVIRTGYSLRLLFAICLLYNTPSLPAMVWEHFLVPLTEDLLHQRRERIGIPTLPLDVHIINLALLEVHYHLQDHGKSMADFPDMPQPDFQARDLSISRLEEEELSYDHDILCERVRAGEMSLNDGQRAIWEVICNAFRDILQDAPPSAKLFFIDGPGGTGKTFLYNLLLAMVRSEGHIALAVASSGIAALLLDGGRTAHSRFKIPIQVHESSTCNLSVNSHMARLIQKAKLIVWDEAPMTHRHAFEAVNRTFQDIMGLMDPRLRDLPFGGKIVLFGGDFRQLLPVVRRGDRATVVRATLRRSLIWFDVRLLKLTTNMRVNTVQGYAREEQEAFAKWLLEVGEGRVPLHLDLGEDFIQVPDAIIVKTTRINDFIDIVYGHDVHKWSDIDFLRGTSILSTKNTTVDIINGEIMSRFPGEEHTFLSADSVSDDEMRLVYPTEFLNTCLPSGLPPHCLTLKIGAPIMLLRNMNGAKGQANGTRLVIAGFSRHLIDATIITGKNIGARVFIPRIPLIASDSGLPFDLRRFQFPIRPAFAMTINKSQGQTLDRVGIYLPNPVFSHGQLYVALSRVGSRNSIHIMTDNENATNKIGIYTRNVVYNEVLN